VLTWSILLYAVSAFLTGFSTNIWMLLVLRCTTFIGVCVEFVAAVAWLAELFPEHERKERVLGYTQAFSSVGGLLVAVVNGLLIRYSNHLPAIDMPDWLMSGAGIQDAHAAWRYTLMSGLIPAIPLIIIRPFLPESPAWAQKRAAGTLKRPSIAELFSPGLARTTIVTTIMFACSYGAAFGALQQIPQMVPGLADVQADVSGQPVKQQRMHYQLIASEYTKLQEIGGLLGRFCLALLAVRILSRRSLLRVFQGPGLIIVPLVFYFFLKVENRHFFEIDLTSVLLGKLPVTTVSLGVMLAGFFTVAQFSFWGNYLPRVYPMHLRGTGESFAANIGGRMIGTSFAWVTATLAPMWTGKTAPEQFALTAACVALFVYGLGLISSFFLPEPQHDHE
jgi:MFS family permease